MMFFPSYFLFSISILPSLSPSSPLSLSLCLSLSLRPCLFIFFFPPVFGLLFIFFLLIYFLLHSFFLPRHPSFLYPPSLRLPLLFFSFSGGYIKYLMNLLVLECAFMYDTYVKKDEFYTCFKHFLPTQFFRENETKRKKEREKHTQSITVAWQNTYLTKE